MLQGRQYIQRGYLTLKLLVNMTFAFTSLVWDMYNLWSTCILMTVYLIRAFLSIDLYVKYWSLCSKCTISLVLLVKPCSTHGEDCWRSPEQITTIICTFKLSSFTSVSYCTASFVKCLNKIIPVTCKVWCFGITLAEVCCIHVEV